MRLHPWCLVCGLHLLAALQTPLPQALLLCRVQLPARTAPAGQALPPPPPPPSLLPPRHFYMQLCFAVCPFPKDLSNHIPIARGFPRMCSCCKPSGSISSLSDLPFGAGYNHPIIYPSGWICITFQLQLSREFGSNLPVVGSPAQAMGPPPILLGGGFASHCDSVWRSPVSTSCTVARRSFLSKDKFAKIRISDYLEIQAKLFLAGETPG